MTPVTVIKSLAAALCLVAVTACLPASGVGVGTATAQAGSYVVVDTGQSRCFSDNDGISCPSAGFDHYGQDAQHQGVQPSYTISADGLTVSDNNTGLIWTKSPDFNGDGAIDSSDKMTWQAALAHAQTLNGQAYGGYGDWRLPSIKELYSLIDFRGTDPSGPESESADLRPYIDSDYFDFGYGDTAAGERIIDAQYWSATEYVASTMDGKATTFGVNFADGRIKGYGRTNPRGETTQYVRYVRGNTAYGVNDLKDNGDGTITDQATALMWSQADSGQGLNWSEALAWVATINQTGYAGYNDWRLPNAKELQSIVDYSRSPDTTDSPAIDPLFEATAIINEGDEVDWPFYWTSTTHISSRQEAPGAAVAYVCFGRGLGFMSSAGPQGQMGLMAMAGPGQGQGPPPGIGPGQGDDGDATLMDVHGAGCQRSDPKVGDPAEFPTGRGPQGDVIRIYNHVRLVRDAG